MRGESRRLRRERDKRACSFRCLFWQVVGTHPRHGRIAADIRRHPTNAVDARSVHDCLSRNRTGPQRHRTRFDTSPGLSTYRRGNRSHEPPSAAPGSPPTCWTMLTLTCHFTATNSKHHRYAQPPRRRPDRTRTVGGRQNLVCFLHPSPEPNTLRRRLRGRRMTRPGSPARARAPSGDKEAWVGC